VRATTWTEGPPSVSELRGRFFAYVLGTALLALAAAATLFAGYALLLGEPTRGFALVVLAALPSGIVLRGLGSPNAEPSRREALAGVLVTWLLMPALSGVPYALTDGVSLVDAFFEGMSGFTTTGATTITDLLALPTSLMLWRAFTQWVGGIGIVVLFVAVFPQLAIAGRQLFFAEQPGTSEERLAPRLRSTAAVVVSLYAGLTALAVVAFLLARMSPVDALAHAFASLSAGGFSPAPAGMTAQAPTVQWVAVAFMFLGGASFPHLYRALSGDARALFGNAEFRAYVAILLVGGLLLTLALLPSFGLWDALRHGVFQAVSLTTTTGFVSDDVSAWSLPAQALLVAFMFIGGSAGSAAGGVKVVRWLIVVKHSVREVRRALHPRAVMPVRVGRRVVPEEVMRAVVAFLTLYLGLFAAGTLTLVTLGADFVTAFTAAIACLGNTGVALGSVGPLGDFDAFHPVSRLVLAFLMYAGRLEVVTVFVVFDASFWRRPRLGGRRPRPGVGRPRRRGRPTERS